MFENPNSHAYHFHSKGEFRVGNYIRSLSNGRIMQMSEGMFPGLQDIVRFFDWYEPIPIDMEWLKRFGFNDEGDHKDSRWSFYVENNGEYCFKIAGLDILYKSKIEYVHQLQNLYFAMIHQEINE